MAETTLVNVGDRAPDFLLQDQHSSEVRLSDLRGRRILLSWHPLAWTRICAEQMKSLDKHYYDLEGLGVMPFGLSVDTVPSKHAWAKELRMEKLRLLSDFWPHGAVAASYGIFRSANGYSERANIILDESQVIVFRKVYPVSELPDINEVLEFLRPKSS